MTFCCQKQAAWLIVSPMNADRFEQLQQGLGYRFAEFTHLQQALTHPSFLNEQEAGGGDYQRLEFLGDAILGMLLAEMGKMSEAEKAFRAAFKAIVDEELGRAAFKPAAGR